jgi:PadR family transcriptional regulator, regulatory protein PadR
MQEVRITLAVLHVLREFVSDVARPRYGYELMEVTGYPSGKLYPILARLTKAGWLTRTRESADPSQAGRPVRFTYKLTAGGAARARQVLAEESATLSPPARMRLQERPEGGGL